MKLVEIKDIPKSIEAPLDDLMGLFSICQKMEKTCIENNGIGLSAVQVGIPWKLFVYWNNYPEKPQKFTYVINSDYEPVGESESNSLESCLSIRNQDDTLKYFKLKRFDNIKTYGKILKCDGDKPHLEDFEFILKDIFCVVFQHEIDHQKGILISDIGEEVILTKY